MDTTQFSFPPPPPPPPPVSQSFPDFNRSRQTRGGFGGQSRGNLRGHQGRWQRNNGGGSRECHTGKPYANPVSNNHHVGFNGPLAPQSANLHGHTSPQREGHYPQIPSRSPHAHVHQFPADIQNEFTHAHPYTLMTALSNFRSQSGFQDGEARHQCNSICQQSGMHQRYLQASSFSLASDRSRTEQLLSKPNLPNGKTGMVGFQSGAGNSTQGGELQLWALSRSNQSNASPYSDGSRGTSSHSHLPGSLSVSQGDGYGSGVQRYNNRGRGQKRGHGEAFGRYGIQRLRTQVAPAVPSFGAPLPVPPRPSLAQESSKKHIKKKRKANQLGLTPKVEEFGSSEEEDDDVDEESKLASGVGGPGLHLQMLQVTYRGQTSTLNSSTDIERWIQERKRKFPTRARAAEIAERTHQREETQRAANQARREARDYKGAEAIGRQRPNPEDGPHKKKIKERSGNAIAESKRKVEKLRQQLEKAERRMEAVVVKVATTETIQEGANKSEAARKSKRSDGVESDHLAKSEVIKPTPINLPNPPNAATYQTLLRPPMAPSRLTKTAAQDFASGLASQQEHEPASASPVPLTPTLQPRAVNEEPDSPFQVLNGTSMAASIPFDPAGADIEEQTREPDHASSIASSDISSTYSDDLTSSSGSSSSSDDSDDVPEQSSSKQNGTERVSPPKRDVPRKVCNTFRDTGKCKWGDNCRYRHELSKRGSRNTKEKANMGQETIGKRVGLYQRLVEQEKEKQDHNILATIIHFGERGLLNESTDLASASK